MSDIFNPDHYQLPEKDLKDMTVNEFLDGGWHRWLNEGDRIMRELYAKQDGLHEPPEEER